MRLKKLIMAFSLCGMFCTVPFTSYAAAPQADTAAPAATTRAEATAVPTTEQATPALCTYFIDVKTDIPLAADDIFKVTISSETGEGTVIEINGKNFAEESYSLPVGSYSVTNIEYKGVNSAVFQQGYGVTKTFTLSAGSVNRISLYIGSTQTSMAGTDILAVSPYSSTAVASTANPSQKTVGSTENNAANNTSASTEESVDNSTETSAIKEDPSDEDVIEEVGQEEEEDADTPKKGVRYYANKLLFCLAIVFVVGVASFIFYRKKGA